MADFKVIRGSSNITSGNQTVVLTEGTDYTLEPGVDNSTAFCRITNTRQTGMGKISGGGNQNTADFSAAITLQEPDTSITFYRYGTTNDTRVDWEIIQYVGPPNGPNAIVVHQSKGNQTVASATITTSPAITATDESKCVVFLTGQACNEAARNNWHSAMWRSNGISSGQSTFTRGDTGSQAIVSWAIVEFTGSNWNIQQDSFTLGDATLTITEVDTSKAFFEVQYTYDNGAATCGLDDAGSKVVMTNGTTLTATSQTATDAASKTHYVYVIENTQLGPGAMLVTHYDITMAGTREEEVDDETITEVADTDATSLWGTSDSTGTGVAYPRGSINLYLQDSTTVRLRQSDSGQTSQVAFQVVEWPTANITPLFWGRAM